MRKEESLHVARREKGEVRKRKTGERDLKGEVEGEGRRGGGEQQGGVRSQSDIRDN